MRQNLFILIALLYAPLAIGQGTVRPNTDYYFDRTDRALVEQLNNVEKFHLPGCAEGVKTRRYQAALDDCEFIFRYFPNHPRALMLMSELCLAWKSPSCDPDMYFENAVKINPKAASTFVMRGIYLLRAKKTSEAITDLKQAATIDPNSLNAQYNLGLAYLETRQYMLANEAAQRAYALGAPVPGLRDKLQKAGYWKPLEPPVAAPETTTPKAAPGDEAPAKAATEPSKN
jgi:tetratricopeptide (TPR) repeat protein